MPGDCVFAVLSILQTPFGPLRFRKSENVREDAACNGGNGVLRDGGIVDELLRLPKIVLLRALVVDYEGVLAVLISDFMINGLSSL